MRGLLDLDSIISETIPLEQINEGFEKMKRGDAARSVIVFDQ
jgi:S-(hydroxymethyl)glutathione dehydrogenase / alcohol dehydrogenase